MIERKVVGMCPPQRLGYIRIIVVFAALLNVLWEPFSSLAEAPVTWYRPEGLMLFIPKAIMIPMLRSGEILVAYKMVLSLFLVFSLIGLATRFSLIVSTMLYFIFIGSVRAYAWFFHTGLIPFYLMFFMIWLPCGDGVSIDNWTRRKFFRKDYSAVFDNRPSPVVGWSVFLLRVVVCACYFQAGYAKLHNSGLAWMAPWNLKHFLIRDSLTIMHFDFDLGIRTMILPDYFFTFLAAAAVFSELFYPVILFSWHLRMIYPLIGAGLHTGILFLQNIFFPDLILIQMIFYDWDRILRNPVLPEFDRRARPPLFPFAGRE